jgi:glycosyltransferase involved in cell wall biosynthesis
VSDQKSPLRILQVAPAVEGGGGEQIAQRLQDAFLSRGERSIVAVGRGSPRREAFRIPNRWECSAYARAIRYGFLKILSVSRGRGERFFFPLAEALAFPRVTWDLWRGNEDFTQPGSRRLLELSPEPPDIVLLHNLHARWDRREGFFDLTYLQELSRRVPVLLFPQDPWLLTGHCAHPIRCPRWTVGCGRCPDLKIYPSVRRDATHWNWSRKRIIFSRSRLHLAAPSAWLQNMFAEAGLPLRGMRVVANGVDTSAFQPGGRGEARSALGFDPHRKIVLITGNYLRTNPWKGYAWVLAVAKLLGAESDVPPTDFHCVGEEGERMEFGRVRILFDGRNIPPERMPSYYRAADIFFHPSRADTAPFSVLEAMSCGLPVMATSVCGIPEQVSDGETGFLAAPGDSQGMADALKRLLMSDSLRVSMGKRARARAVEKFEFSNQVGSLLEYMREIVAEK